MNSERTVNRAISEGNIRDVLIPFLVQIGYIDKDEDLIGMDLGPWKDLGELSKNGRGTIPITLRVKSTRDIMEEVIKKNGETG